MSLDRALELAAAGAGIAYPNPTVGAVVAADGEIVGEGVTEADGGRHGEIVALAAAGDRARGATLYVTMEPCAHHGKTPPCVDAIVAAGVARVVAGCLDPNPEAAGGLEQLRHAGVEAELDDRFEARRQNEAWRTWKALARPFVTYKVATTLDGRVTVPGTRWVTGEASRRLVHELRAASDAVAVGMGTVRADAPRLDARDVPVVRQPRRLAFGRGPLPGRIRSRAPPGPACRGARGSCCRRRPVDPARGRSDPRDGVSRSGSHRQAARVRGADARRSGPRFLDELPRSTSSPPVGRPIGEDVLLEAYAHAPVK